MAYLMARPVLGALDEIKLWVGVFGVAQPPAVEFTVDGAPCLPVTMDGLHPIRDRTPDKGYLNYQGLFTFETRGAGCEHQIVVRAGAGFEPCALRVFSLPAKVPQKMEGSFKILLSSCYCVETDKANVGRFIQSLPVRPDISLFAGDQVYLDQLPFETLPTTEDELRQVISKKYQRNWTSTFKEVAGLQSALAKAPAVCLPDDHEFWNNYPWPQFWKRGTQTAPTPGGGVNIWADAALEMFQDYQVGGSAQKPWLRVDIEPLFMLFLDTRSYRKQDFNDPFGLMPEEAEQALKQWASELIDCQNQGIPRIGVLSTGQALLVKTPFFDEMGDAELSNYKGQFKVIIETLERLGQHGIQVVFLTGDVHWSRVAQANCVKRAQITLTEVICSPMSLLVTPGSDQVSQLKDYLKSIFGERKRWPLHPEAELAPAYIGGKSFRPVGQQGWSGNQVAVLEFSCLGLGVELNVTYHPITAPASPATRVGPFTLLNT
jgi:hypothetical protein